VEPDIAEVLLQRMAAEKISNKVIRRMPPNSVFLPAIKEFNPTVRYISVGLPPLEPGGTKFVGPVNRNSMDLVFRAKLWVKFAAIR